LTKLPKEPEEIDLVKQMGIIDARISDILGYLDERSGVHEHRQNWMFGLTVAFSFLMLINTTTLEIHLGRSDALFWVLVSGVLFVSARGMVGKEKHVSPWRMRCAI
jgi:hypothetical protein